MHTLIMERFCYSDNGTFGWLTTPIGRRFATVERPWLDNRIGVSCIPVGVYDCEPSRFNRGGYDSIELVNVDGRTQIKMHVANLPYEVNGCIGINNRFGVVHGQWAGVDSKNAFKALMQELGQKRFNIEIKNKQAGQL